MSQILTIEWAGQVDYLIALKQQQDLVAERTTSPEIEDRLLLLEHPPTYTLGKTGDMRHILLNETQLAQHGFAFYRVERGGDITYHGPGQLVGYPILNLKRLSAARGLDALDLHSYLRDIEEVLIQALAAFGVSGWRYDGYTGVWVSTATGPHKIAAIGVRVNSKGISSHGFALNVNPNMDHFQFIVPCGIQEHGVISLAQILGRPITIQDVLPSIIHAFCRVFRFEERMERG